MCLAESDYVEIKPEVCNTQVTFTQALLVEVWEMSAEGRALRMNLKELKEIDL